MPVTRAQILLRGLTHRCPNCGGHTLFRAGTWFQMNPQCPACGFRFEGTGDDGQYLRATSLNFGVTVTCFLFPVLLLFHFDCVGATTAEVLAFAGTVVVPVLNYRASRSWGLMNYYIFFPEALPANHPVDRSSVRQGGSG
jgi:uncharacterized protein (DUF983 family)